MPPPPRKRKAQAAFSPASYHRRKAKRRQPKKKKPEDKVTTIPVSIAFRIKAAVPLSFWHTLVYVQEVLSEVRSLVQEQKKRLSAQEKAVTNTLSAVIETLDPLTQTRVTSKKHRSLMLFYLYRLQLRCQYGSERHAISSECQALHKALLKRCELKSAAEITPQWTILRAAVEEWDAKELILDSPLAAAFTDLLEVLRQISLSPLHCEALTQVQAGRASRGVEFSQPLPFMLTDLEVLVKTARNVLEVEKVSSDYDPAVDGPDAQEDEIDKLLQ